MSSRDTRTVTQLWRQMKRRGIAQKAVAAQARVTQSMVSKVVNGRAVSQPVVDAIRELLGR